MLAFSVVVLGFGSFPKPERSWLLASTGTCAHQSVAAMGPVPAGYKSAIAFDFFPASTMAFTDAPFHQSEEIFGLGVEAEDLENSAWDYKNIALLEPVRAAHSRIEPVGRITRTARAFASRVPARRQPTARRGRHRCSR